MAKPHWLSPAGATKTPQTLVVFDTEARSTRTGEDEVLTLRCWDALVRRRGPSLPPPGVAAAAAGETAAELCELVEAAAELSGEAWVFAHNLGFDLTLTSLPMVLAERGWQTPFLSIGDESCVFSFERDGRKLLLTDSWSWLRSGLREAAVDVGMRVSRLPGEEDDAAAWHRRCAHDVKILDALLCELLDWWDRAQLGSFGPTSPACGWRSLRAKNEPKRILVGTEQPRTAFEREALYGGRKEVWQVGEVSGRWVADYDLRQAHLQIAAHLPLPSQPLHGRQLDAICDPLAPPERIGSICEVQITTHTPCAPCRVDKDIYWPTGTFRATLTSPELAVVAAIAQDVEVLAVRWYRLDDALAGWGRWCMELLNGAHPDVPKVARRVAKGWSRSVPGRFALRTHRLTDERHGTHLGWAIESGTDHRTGASIEIITLAGVERTYAKDQDGADVSPAVLAFVEGHLRAAMAQTIASRDPARMLQCNTDGWWEVCAGPVSEHGPPPVSEPFTAIRRAHERYAHVIGPNHIVTSGERRLSGVPAAAAALKDGRWRWRDWPGLRWQLQHSRPGEYRRPGREMRLHDHYCRRWVLRGGETVPVSAYVGAEAENRIRPWRLTSGRWRGDQLDAHQIPALRELASWAPVAEAPERPRGEPPLGRRGPGASAS